MINRQKLYDQILYNEEFIVIIICVEYNNSTQRKVINEFYVEEF